MKKKIKVYATFKLSSDGTLLVDQYDHIVGSSESNQDFKSMKIF